MEQTPRPKSQFPTSEKSKQLGIQHQTISVIEDTMMDSKPLIDEKHRGSTFDDIEELKVSNFGGGAGMKPRDSLLLDKFPD